MRLFPVRQKLFSACVRFLLSYMAEDQLLIGVSDGELDPRRFRSSVLTNKVGGQPDWPPVLAPRSPTCGCCGSPLALVVQVYCPLQGSSFHRILHLFGCCRPGCSGQQAGWTALRSQWVEAPCQPPPPQGALPSATDWCESADDWGMEEGGGAEELQDGGLRTEGGSDRRLVLKCSHPFCFWTDF